MNALDLNNVLLPDGADKSTAVIVSPLAPVMWELANKNPRWVFKADTVKGNVAFKFVVFLEKEHLGYISTTQQYTRTGGAKRVIVVSNKRIAKTMNRRDYVSTADGKKAIALVTKWFYPENIVEKINAATTLAKKSIGEVLWSKNSESSDYSRVTKNAVADFINTSDGVAAFTKYLTDTCKHEILMSMQQGVVLSKEIKTIQDIQIGVSDGTKTALVVLDAGKYLVKAGEDIALYDDTTFPIELRGKLGMLKLVLPQQFVSDTGCRISDEVFVIVLAQEGETK